MNVSSIDLSLTVESTSCNSHITISLALDDHIVSTIPLSEFPQNLQCSLPDTDGQHVLEIIMSGKTMDDTVIDQDGNISDDVLVDIKNIEFDGISIEKIMWEKSVYIHDYNGTKDPISDRFFGTMGCNGRVRLEFTTPLYIWLLENM